MFKKISTAFFHQITDAQISRVESRTLLLLRIVTSQFESSGQEKQNKETSALSLCNE